MDFKPYLTTNSCTRDPNLADTDLGPEVSNRSTVGELERHEQRGKYFTYSILNDTLKNTFNQ